MPEPIGLRNARAVCALALTLWIGAVVHFAVAITPAIFSGFPDRGGEIVETLFPGYFQFGLVTAGLALLAALWGWLAAGWLRTQRESWRVLWALLTLALVAANAYALRPTVHAASAGEFGFWHGLSMAANAVAAVTALAGAAVSFSSSRVVR